MRLSAFALLCTLTTIPLAAQQPAERSAERTAVRTAPERRASLGTAVGSTAVPSSVSAGVRVVSSDEGGITIEITGLRGRVVGRGKSATIVHNAGRYFFQDDSVSIPGLSFLLGVPSGAEGFTAVATTTRGDTVPVDLPAGSLLLQSRSDRPVVSVDPSANLFGLRTVLLRFRPFRIAGTRMIASNSTRIVVSWHRGSAPSGTGGVARSGGAAEVVLSDAVLNYDRARAWRTATAASSAPRIAAAQQGMGEGVVMQVASEGIYRLRGADLATVGVTRGMSIADLRIRTRDRFIRFYVNDRNGNALFDDDDYLEFRGWRNVSPDGFYWDETTDTNAFILTWHGGDGAKPQLEAAPGTGSAPALVAYDSTLHAEEEKAYGYGPTLPGFGDIKTVHNVDRAVNERYYWLGFAGGTKPNPDFFFDCSPYYAENQTVTVRIRMVGQTFRTHGLRFFLNGDGKPIGTAELPDTADRIYEFTVPASFLVNGRNKLTVETYSADSAADTMGKPDYVFLDYIELKGRWLPSTFGPVATLRLPGGPVRATVDGLTSDPAVAISDERHVTVDSVQRGLLFRLSSRQFLAEQRYNPGIVAQFGDGSVVQAAPYQFGTFIAEADGSTGRMIRNRFFATQDQSEVDAAVDFLAGVQNGNVVIAGFVLGAMQDRFPDNLRNAFAALGSQVATGAGLGNASWVFCARKGSPETAQERYASLPVNHVGVSMNAFIPSSNGAYTRATLTVDGAAGTEYTLGAPVTPTLRYHRADELRDPSNTADLLIITHKAFRAASERLAEHRRKHDGYVVKVVDVEQVYDEFNDGVKSAGAIRSFLQYADQNWGSPRPTYVLLFGDASTDPQQRLTGSRMIDYVPSYGIPSSDYMLSVYPGDSTMAHQFIGRIPAATVNDAETVVDKIVEYDTLPPQHWDKRFVMLTGGQDLSEKAGFEQDAEGEAEFFILSPQFLGDTALIHRLDTDNVALHGVSEREGPWARDEINKGALWVSYTGHGSGNVVELNYGFPEDFDNGNRYFVISTFSCQTGAYAESDVPVRNERFVTAPGRGAIAAIGGSSFSFSDNDRELRQGMYSQIVFEKERALGKILQLAKYKFFEQYMFGWSSTYNGIRARNAIAAYNLLGDPSMKLKTRLNPELALNEGDVVVLNKAGGPPHLGDSLLKVTAVLWNYGLPIDAATSDTAIMVAASIVDLKGNVVRDTVIARWLARSAALTFDLPISQDPGEYTIRIEADPEHHVGETYLPDNVVSVKVPIRGNQPLVLEPRSFGIVPGYDDVAIRLLNPPSGPGADITVDTTDTFDSPAAFTNAGYGTTKLGELTTVWTFSIPQALRGARRFWYRAVATTGDTAVARLFPLIESFTVDPVPGKEYVVGGVRQMSYAVNVNLANRQDGIGPGSRMIDFEILSIGQDFDTSGAAIPALDAIFKKDGRNVKSGNYDGINVIVIDPVTAAVKASGEFAFYNKPYDQNRFIGFVRDSVKEGDLVMIGERRPAFKLDRTDPVDSAVIAVLKDLGSTVIDSVGPLDTYAMVGGKGLPAEKRREVWLRRDSLVQIAHRNPPFLADIHYGIPVASMAGQLTLPAVGPARKWRSLRLDVAGSSPLDVTVFGVRRDGVRDSLLRVTTLDTVDLRSVDPAKYPNAEFLLRFVNDSLSRLRSALVDFDPSPELAIVPSTFRFEVDSVLQGDPLVLRATVANLSSRFQADSVPVQILYNDENQLPPIDTRVIDKIAPLDSVAGTFTIGTDRMRGIKSIALVANPADVPAELYPQNNKLAATVRVGVDDVTPSIALYADGNRLMDGDYTSPQATLEVRIYDNSQLKLDSASTVTMILDNDIITSATAGATFRVGGTGGLRGAFLYKPLAGLAEGEHLVRIFTTDASGNGDTTPFVQFFVEKDLHLKQVVNVPNPFVEKTTFTFMVTGVTPPTGGEIAIFTVAGRKIKSIPLSPADLHVGFNKIEWDGLDGDRDRLANGVYLYRVTVENGDSKDQAIEKIVVMR